MDFAQARVVSPALAEVSLQQERVPDAFCLSKQSPWLGWKTDCW